MRSIAALLIVLALPASAPAVEIKTNAVHMADAPEWLTPGRIDAVVEHIQGLLEWDIRRVEVRWFKDQDAFEASHGFGPAVLAISRKSDNSVNIGPRVNKTNFDAVFGHEMVHIISFQKYKEAIPQWLEEGLANYLAKNETVDYAWMARHKFPGDVRELTHPFNGSLDHIRYSYMASQALIEMIASKCDLSELLRLSVGRKMENYFDTYCGIKDLNSDFRKWLKKRSSS